MTRWILFTTLLTSSLAAFAVDDGADEGIATAVASELALDEELSKRAIGVEVEDGVVILSGTLPTLFLKERASQVTGLVRGVRAVVNRIEIEAPPLSDGALREELSRAVEAGYESSTAGPIGIAVEDGVVVLTGVVPSLRHKLRIGEIVQAVSGVRAVDDRLRVERLPRASDRELQSAVRRLLDWDSRVDASGVEVACAEGAVRIEGSVGSVAEKSRVIDLAGIPGVVSVDATGLQVVGRADAEWLRPGRPFEEGEMPDEEIEQAVQDALFYDPRVRSFEVRVDVSDGVASLRGAVESLRAKLAAEEDAAGVVGILAVDNRLEVRARPTRPDSAVAADVKRVLMRDGYLDGAEGIVVLVEEGRVRLHGTVATELRRERAEELASAVAGVVDVSNRIEVERLETFARKSDGEILDAIREQLRRSALVDLDEIEVRVEDGMATLTGVVESLAARRAASRDAFQAGAVLVKNQLEVRGPSTESDRGR